jgi:NAD+ kinase
MGRLGFLAELQPADAEARLDSYLEGDYWLDRRAMLRTDVIKVGDDWLTEQIEPSSERSYLALNDIVLGRGAAIRTVSVEISMAGQSLHEFRCDGVIVATATGSTAYSFASGGPVLSPASKDTVITPIAPHLSTLKSFVVPSGSSIRLRVSSSEVAVLTIDGQVDRPLGAVGVVEVGIAELTTLFARQGTEVELYRRLLAKLG